MTTKRMMGTAAAVAIGSVGALVALSSPGDQGQGVTLTGCLRTGSSATIYVLRGASEPSEPAAPGREPQAPTTPPDDYVLVSVPAQIDLSAHLNHRIGVTGVISDAKDPPPPPAGANAAERGLKKLSVQTVREVASNCAAK